MVPVFSLAAGLLGLLWPSAAPAPAGGPRAPAATSLQSPAADPLFAREEALGFTLLLPLDEVLDDMGKDAPALRSAVIQYPDAPGGALTLPVQVRVRGHRRKDPAVCAFPPLLLRFAPNGGAAAVFGPTAELKLTTHCQHDKYVLREYLVYKLYNTLTDTSFRVRLCRVTYQDVLGRHKPSVHYAFLLEDAAAMARRSHATIIPKVLTIGMQHTEPAAMVRLALFQYMIGNTDWSVPYRHNIRLLSMGPQAPRPVPVPYDFDYCGLVMAPYAAPPEQLGLGSVRQRLFRGYSFSAPLYAQTRAFFNARRPACYNVYLSCALLSREEKLFATRFLDEFYETINNPREFERSITRIGMRNEKQYTNIKGLR